MMKLKGLVLLFFVWFVTGVAHGTTRDIYFYLSTDFAPISDPDYLAKRAVMENNLTTFVGHLNEVFAKNTGVVLNYQPSFVTWVSQAEAQNPTDNYFGSFENTPANFHLAVHVPKSTTTFGSAHHNRTEVNQFSCIMHNGWGGIYSQAESLSSPPGAPENTVGAYRTQLYYTLHELGHAFGAGGGEYYRLMGLTDTTGGPINASESISSPGPYWNARSNVSNDPLQNVGDGGSTVASLVAYYKYCELTRTIINRQDLYRNPPTNYFNGGGYSFWDYSVPNNYPVTLTTVKASDRTVVPGAYIYVYKTIGEFFNTTTDLANPIFLVTDQEGRVTFNWPTGNRAVLIRVVSPAEQKAWLTQFDLQAWYLNGAQNGSFHYYGAITFALNVP
jgi:hypothetical protein